MAKTKKIKKTKTAQRAKPNKPVKKKAAAKRPTKRAAPKLGRPTVTGEEKLYMLFHEDYHARQVFEFLRVETVAELEQFEPDRIFRLLTKPVRDTLNRIRTRLAERNRCLLGDEEFAQEVKERRV
jgi:hypothetical protein